MSLSDPVSIFPAATCRAWVGHHGGFIGAACFFFGLWGAKGGQNIQSR